jgi:hypothetical protein
MSSPAQAPQPEAAIVRQPEELLYDFEAALRLVDHAIAELSELESPPLYPTAASVEASDTGEGEPS